MRLRGAAVLAATILAGLAARAAASEPGDLAVVVGRQSRVTAVSRDELRELYLRRRRVWPDGTPALPVNLPADHPLRARFSRLVLGRDPGDLRAYWNARYFDGVSPPAVLPSPAAVRAFVAAEKGAIGYVPADEVDDGCRVVLVLPAGERD